MHGYKDVGDREYGDGWERIGFGVLMGLKSFGVDFESNVEF